MYMQSVYKCKGIELLAKKYLKKTLPLNLPWSLLTNFTSKLIWKHTNIWFLINILLNSWVFVIFFQLFSFFHTIFFLSFLLLKIYTIVNFFLWVLKNLLLAILLYSIVLSYSFRATLTIYVHECISDGWIISEGDFLWEGGVWLSDF